MSSFDEGIRRIRSLRLPALSKDGYDAFEYSMGQYREAEDTGVWWGYREAVDDPDASGGKALKLAKAGRERRPGAHLDRSEQRGARGRRRDLVPRQEWLGDSCSSAARSASRIARTPARLRARGST